MTQLSSKLTILPTREDHLVAGLAALAICIHVLESAFPSPLPGIKPGLANVITLIAFLRFGWSVAAWVTVLRVIVGSLVVGTFLSPTFVLSLAGALSNITLLWCISRLKEINLGPIGLSILTALAHIFGQFFVAYLLFIPHPALFNLLPIFSSTSIIFGFVSGLICHQTLLKLDPQSNHDDYQPQRNPN